MSYASVVPQPQVIKWALEFRFVLMFLFALAVGCSLEDMGTRWALLFVVGSLFGLVPAAFDCEEESAEKMSGYSIAGAKYCTVIAFCLAVIAFLRILN